MKETVVIVKGDVGKVGVMAFERREIEVVFFNTPYKVNVLAVGNEKGKFKYLGTMLCKHGQMEGGIRERVVKYRCVIGPLACIMR